MLQPPRIMRTQGLSLFCASGYAREIPFGCIDNGLLSILYFLPGQAMRPHRHTDADEYFTAIDGDAVMVVNGEPVALPQAHTYFRTRGTLHALRNDSSHGLVVQSFQVPIPADEATSWESVAWWHIDNVGTCCVRCWCGQREGSHCANCGAMWHNHPPDASTDPRLSDLH